MITVWTQEYTWHLPTSHECNNSPGKWQTALVYLYDIVIFYKTTEEHITPVKQMLTLLQKERDNLELKKCMFFTNTIDSARHIVRMRRLEISSQTTIAIRERKEPRSVTELRSFQGLYSFFKNFVSNIARMEAPLNQKPQKDQRKKFRPLKNEGWNAVTALQEKLISPPILALPYAGGLCTLYTDLCNIELGCMLLQQYPEMARSFIEAGHTYDATQRECMAIVWSTILLRSHVEGSRLTIRTDHDSLCWILNLIDTNGRLA